MGEFFSLCVSLQTGFFRTCEVLRRNFRKEINYNGLQYTKREIAYA